MKTNTIRKVNGSSLHLTSGPNSQEGAEMRNIAVAKKAGALQKMVIRRVRLEDESKFHSEKGQSQQELRGIQ